MTPPVRAGRESARKKRAQNLKPRTGQRHADAKEVTGDIAGDHHDCRESAPTAGDRGAGRAADREVMTVRDKESQRTGVLRLLLTPEQAAETLAIGRTTLYGLLSTGALPSVHIGGSRRIPYQAIRDVHVGRREIDARLLSYNQSDAHATVWKPGCFAASLAKRLPPVLCDHRHDRPIGKVTSYRDRNDGLDITVRMADFDAVPDAKMVYNLAEDGVVEGVSGSAGRRWRRSRSASAAPTVTCRPGTWCTARISGRRRPHRVPRCPDAGCWRCGRWPR